jgi:hypothetical protein
MEAKGTAIAILPLFIKERFGVNGHRKWHGALSPKAQAIFGKEILLTDWFPVQEGCIEPTAILCRLFYTGDLQGAWDLGRFSADYGLRGVYKTFAKPNSVQSFITRSGMILKAYYSPCQSEIDQATDNSAVLRITSFPEYADVIEQRIAGWMQRALEIHGCTGVKVAVAKSLLKKDSCTELAATWK